MLKYFCILLLISSNLFSSDFGTSGIIDTPDARMLKDGSLKVTFSHQDIANITNITYQATPWLETTFRYSYGPAYKDRSYAAKIRLLKESTYKPNISLGIQDILGTGVLGSEYIVASKKIRNIDISIGLGWGRLADRKSISNPFSKVSKSFLGGDADSQDFNLGGRVRNGSFFKGSHAGIFGGVKYTIPNTSIKLLAEYNTDSYQTEILKGIIPDSSPLSYGIEWDGASGINFSLTHQQGNQIGFSFSSLLDTKFLPPERKIEPFFSSSDDFISSVTDEELDFDSWYDRLLYDFKQSGLLLRSAKILPNNQAVIEFSNFRYNIAAEAINRALTLSQIHLSNNINNIKLIINENGFRVMTIDYKRSNIDKNIFSKHIYSNIEIIKAGEIKNPSNYTKRAVPHTNISANLATKFQLFDPDNPLKHQIFLKILTATSLSQNWSLIGSFALDIDNNFNLSRGPNSVLEHVRTDINKYLVYGSSGIESLYLEKKSTYKDQLHYRAYLGILETMYSGLGMEVLYQPFRSRFAFGGTFNSVIKRGYKRNFDLLDYKTTTAFLSLYYASSFYNYDFAVHLGKYLAKDNGATIELRRTFDNGFSVGAFVTLTNISASDFGEGSFDKGLYFRIPFDFFISNNEKGSFSTMIRSLQRDGGQKLDDFTGRLWSDLRSVRYDSLQNNKMRMIPK